MKKNEDLLKTLQQIKRVLRKIEFYLTINEELYGTMILDVNGEVTLLKGSKIRPDMKKYKNAKYTQWIYKKRDKFRNLALLRKNRYGEEILTMDVNFKSASSAAAFLSGKLMSRTCWRTEENYIVDELLDIMYGAVFESRKRGENLNELINILEELYKTLQKR